jgi:hypothetical protein
MGESRGICRVFMGKPEGKRLLGRPGCRMEDSIEMDIQKLECGALTGNDRGQNKDRWQALVNAVMNFQFL